MVLVSAHGGATYGAPSTKIKNAGNSSVGVALQPNGKRRLVRHKTHMLTGAVAVGAAAAAVAIVCSRQKEESPKGNSDVEIGADAEEDAVRKSH